MTKEAPNLAVIGGGPTGLLSAYYALKQGQPASSITVYEASGRTGGHAGGQGAAHLGPEFIDSDDTRMIALAKELGVPLQRSTDQQTLRFQTPSGQLMSEEEFLPRYAPLAEQIREDKARAAKDPAFAKELDGKNLETYLAELAARAQAKADKQKTYFQTVSDYVMPWSYKRVAPPEVVKTVQQAYASEVGQPASRINALQFAQEMSAKCDASGNPATFMDSDCAFRVKGGPEELFAKLRQKLELQGVNFETGAQLSSVSRAEDGLTLGFGEKQVKADKLVMAVPAHALSGIEGLEALGMDSSARQTAENLQYTHNAKFTIKLREGVQLPEETSYFNAGFQTWMRPGEGSVTFLVGGDMR